MKLLLFLSHLHTGNLLSGTRNFVEVYTIHCGQKKIAWMRYMRHFSQSSFDGVYPSKQLYSSTYLGLLIPLNHMFTYQGSSGTGSTKCRPNIGTIWQARRFRIKPRWRTKVSNRFTHESLFKAWFRDDLGIYTSCGCRCGCCCTLTYQSLTMMIIQNISQGSTDIFG